MVGAVRREFMLSVLNWYIVEVSRCANCVLDSMIERASINLELVLSIIVTICRCQMLRTYDCVLLNQDNDFVSL